MIGPGDRVECVFDKWITDRGESCPVAGAIYTVRDVGECCFGFAEPKVPSIRLDEIKNPVVSYAEYTGEAWFELRHFRPVRTTDISTFTEIDQEVKDGQPRILEDA